jgi:GWxTD domain-containing protein
MQLGCCSLRGELNSKARIPLLMGLAWAACAADSGWLDRVAPIMTLAQKKLYVSLAPEARPGFEQEFWEDKSISAQEYFRRIAYIDSKFGSNRSGSGANTDQGRVYLSLGPPGRITRLPSSRIFVPLEIWYYDSVPGVLNTELRLIFFRAHIAGFPKLYSPLTDTIRALLAPQASTRNMFGPNDSATESDIRNILQVPAAEDEVITAAVAVASGIKDVGNEQILGRIASPRATLTGPVRTEVHSRLILGRPALDVLQTASPYGASQVDLRFEASAQRELELEVLQGASTVYQNRLHLQFPETAPVAYVHRLDLLPGSYRLVLTVDDTSYPYVIEVARHVEMSEIVRVNKGDSRSGRHSPFEFDGQTWELDPEGRFALVALPQPGKVTWTLRRGMSVIWRSSADAGQAAVLELPTHGLAPGTYQLEAATADQFKSIEYTAPAQRADAPQRSVISFNANLAPALRLAFIGHQWLLRGNLEEANRSLEKSLALGATDEAHVELSRTDAIAGRLDSARDRVRKVLERKPNDFEALSVYAYIEARLQDYPVAAELYRRALAVHDSPALRAALAQLPTR